MGDDALAAQLKAANDKEGLKSAYYVLKGEKTGACAVIITGHHRSVIALQLLSIDHVSTNIADL